MDLCPLISDHTNNLDIQLSIAYLDVYTGNANLINKFVSWEAFIALSRLTYSVYLPTHGLCIIIGGPEEI
jgi:hypothetical protein